MKHQSLEFEMISIFFLVPILLAEISVLLAETAVMFRWIVL
jgi:hypothetical protein